MTIKPATPLPFVAADDGKTFGIYYVTFYGSEGAEDFARIATISTKNTGQREDAAYIAHACNAYPRLVEVLREILTFVPRDDATLEQYVAARALLAELGEQ